MGSVGAAQVDGQPPDTTPKISDAGVVVSAVLLVIVALLLGFLIGYVMGTQQTQKNTVKGMHRAGWFASPPPSAPGSFKTQGGSSIAIAVSPHSFPPPPTASPMQAAASGAHKGSSHS